MSDFNTSEISRLIRSRRSVFPAQYSGETVKDEIIKEMLENANWAPTHKFTEPWRFTIFKGKGLKMLGNFMAELYEKVSKKAENFELKKFEMLKNKPLLASHVIAIGMKRDELERVPEIEEIEAVACAVQNMCLTAAAHRVGCYWGTGGITYFEDAKPFFNLEKSDKLLGFLFVGMPKALPQKGRRKPVEEKVRWVND